MMHSHLHHHLHLIICKDRSKFKNILYILRNGNVLSL